MTRKPKPDSIIDETPRGDCLNSPLRAAPLSRRFRNHPGRRSEWHCQADTLNEHAQAVSARLVAINAVLGSCRLLTRSRLPVTKA